MNREEIIRRLKELPYDPKEYWAVYETAEVLYGMEKGAAMIKLGCTSGMADRLKEEGCRLLSHPYDRQHRTFRISDDIIAREDEPDQYMELVDGVQVVSKYELEDTTEQQMGLLGLAKIMRGEYRSEHHIFYSRAGSFADRHIVSIAAMQEQVFRRICDTLKTEPDYPIRFYLFDSPEQVGRLAGGKSGNAFALPPDRVFAVCNERISGIGFHEVVHLISDRIHKQDNLALSEGLANYFEGNWWGIHVMGWAAYYLKKGTMPELTDLLDNEYFSAQDSFVTYPVSGTFVYWLVTSGGMEKFLKFYRYDDPAEGMREVYHTELKKVGEMFRDSCGHIILKPETEEAIEQVLKRRG